MSVLQVCVLVACAALCGGTIGAAAMALVSSKKIFNLEEQIGDLEVKLMVKLFSDKNKTRGDVNDD